MAFFKLSDLSEKEKKKYLQSIEDQVNERLNSRNSLEKEANDNFNNIFNSKYGQNNNINVGNTNDWATSKIKEKKSAEAFLKKHSSQSIFIHSIFFLTSRNHGRKLQRKNVLAEVKCKKFRQYIRKKGMYKSWKRKILTGAASVSAIFRPTSVL